MTTLLIWGAGGFLLSSLLSPCWLKSLPCIQDESFVIPLYPGDKAPCVSAFSDPVDLELSLLTGPAADIAWAELHLATFSPSMNNNGGRCSFNSSVIVLFCTLAQRWREKRKEGSEPGLNWYSLGIMGFAEGLKCINLLSQIISDAECKDLNFKSSGVWMCLISLWTGCRTHSVAL